MRIRSREANKQNRRTPVILKNARRLKSTPLLPSFDGIRARGIQLAVTEFSDVEATGKDTGRAEEKIHPTGIASY